MECYCQNLAYTFSLITELRLNFSVFSYVRKSKNDTSEVKTFSFLSCSFEEYVIVKFLSNSRTR